MIEDKLNEMGLSIPEVPKPLAAYIPGIQSGNYIFTSGQVPLANGQLKYKGKVGKDISDEDAKLAAQTCVLNCLGVIKSLIGDANKIKRIIKLVVFVNCTDDYTAQPAVANGASELLLNLFGENGKHVRSAVGVSGLPLGAPVEIEMIAEIQN